MLLCRRAHVDATVKDNAGGSKPTLDPRFLVFEFCANIVLRPQQVELLGKLVAGAREGRSLCHQMIMGEGKTTVVAPLVALLLADGSQLVISVVPAPLLSFSLSVLRGCFGGGALRKPVWTFGFDRRSEVTAELVEKAHIATEERAVMVTTPSAVKAFLLKLLELLHLLDTGQYPKKAAGLMSRMRARMRGKRTTQREFPFDKVSLHAQAERAVQIFGVWRRAVAVIDEVDVVLHPLRSELNWPLGDKHPLDFAPTRWELPWHLLDALVSLDSSGAPSNLAAAQAAAPPPAPVAGSTGAKEAEIVAQLRAAVAAGVAAKLAQRTPHFVLLSEAWYLEKLRPILAEWLALFVRKLGLRALTDAQIAKCLLTPGATKDPAVQNELSDAHVKALNLGADWLNHLLPHVLKKVNRVSYGLLQPAEMAALAALRGTTDMPRSRRLLSVPFVGKDAPSHASEYAHPDVAVGLTTLAYRYEGLRPSDFQSTLQQLRASLEGELGPELKRPSSLVWIGWVQAAGKRVRGTKSAKNEGSMTTLSAEGLGESDVGLFDILPLHLLDMGDADYLRMLYRMLRYSALVIRHYLENLVFPEVTAHQASKLSANGQELGGEMLFARRIAFSGTPSSLLPLEMGECAYQKGDDAKMLRTLSDPAVVSHHAVDDGWSPASLLKSVAALRPPVHALIDAGALVTGFSNRAVAAFLLPLLGAEFEGVVYLEQGGHKRILLRHGAAMDLERCGLPPERRFSFYDQVHTTGIDVPQTPSARAALTLSKDMTFRDYAQAAYRMRGIGKGQRILLFVIPEVARLIGAEAARGRGQSADARSKALAALPDGRARAARSRTCRRGC